MSDFDAEKMIQQYEPLFHKVLRFCYIRPAQADYEDYLQILRIACFEKSQELDLSEPTKSNITLLFRFLVWKVRDQQRLVKKQQALLEKVMEQPLAQTKEMDPTKLNFEAGFEVLWEQLSIGEKRYLAGRLHQHLSLQEIADYHGVSRMTVSRWKKQLRTRLSKLNEA